MKALIQRVKRASVTIDGMLYSKISKGILVLLGVEKGDGQITGQIDYGYCIFVGFNNEDTNEIIDKMIHKILFLRIFEDENGKMNKSVSDITGEILVVSQFTLCGDCKKGTRPSFDKSAPPEIAEDLYEYFVERFKTLNIPVCTGKFRAMMDVELINDGPVTFMIEK